MHECHIYIHVQEREHAWTYTVPLDHTPDPCPSALREVAIFMRSSLRPASTAHVQMHVQMHMATSGLSFHHKWHLKSIQQQQSQQSLSCCRHTDIDGAPPVATSCPAAGHHYDHSCAVCCGGVGTRAAQHASAAAAAPTHRRCPPAARLQLAEASAWLPPQRVRTCSCSQIWTSGADRLTDQYSRSVGSL